MEELSAEQRLVFNAVKDTSRIVVLGWMAAVAVLATKLLAAKDVITVAGIELNVRYAWVLLAVFSVIHLFKGIFIMRHISEYTRYGSFDRAAERTLYKAIRAESNPLIHGLRPRPLRPGPGARLDPADPSYWVAYLAQIGTFTAALPWTLKNGHPVWPTGWTLWLTVLAVSAFLGINWIVGSHWLAAVAELSGEDGADLVRSAPIRTVGWILSFTVFIIALPARIVFFPFFLWKWNLNYIS
ncbi:hypothetical protein [Actinomadura chokoriensis]|uniref:Uncharacterized protein n=1 Tax=Actinomadura chokoriensis TaxID=454156 RepID=A0ABV4QSW1_9ACTN